MENCQNGEKIWLKKKDENIFGENNVGENFLGEKKNGELPKW